MKVLKFGGTSVGSAQNINRVISIVEELSSNHQIICVVSAVGGITDQLQQTGQLAQLGDTSYLDILADIEKKHFQLLDELIPVNSYQVKTALEEKLKHLKSLLSGIYLINELSPKTLDKLLSFGEQLSSFIISETLIVRNLDASLKNTQDLILTDENFIKAHVFIRESNENITNYFRSSKHKITILPGFVARSHNGNSTTLGRGGSDYTAALVAAALKSKELEIWTDVSGMYTANPKLVKQAYPIEQINYQEAMELSHFGAKVLYPPSIQPVLELKIPIVIKNTLQPQDKGTYISSNAYQSGQSATGISNIDNIALLTLQGSGMVGIPGFSKRLFEQLALDKINVILITQASSEHSICIAIDQTDIAKAESGINHMFSYEIEQKKLNPVLVENDLAIIALVGSNMKHLQGMSGKMFGALGRNNINIVAIAQGSSEINISAVIDQKDVKKGLNTLHERFFEGNHKQVNLFIAGVGNVGEKLIAQIRQQRKYLKEKLKLNLRIIGVSNSRKMYFNSDGIDPKTWKEGLQNGENASLEGFYDRAVELNLRNSVFVDVTASAAVAQQYEHYLKESIAVVACNKIACSAALENYQKLKNYSLKYNAPFLFETNVGAGLPIIDTLQNLISSGDKIVSIQAVLSGSLNFVFNNFTNETKFHDIVKQAQEQGFTEPDPRIDLSGVDVARKILILARESGLAMNLKDIKNNSFLTDKNNASDTVDDFYRTLLEDEQHFQSLYASAKAKQQQLKYVATLTENEASVGLQEIPVGHPFYNLKGSDNIVMFYTARYPEQPLIVKGAGAGADVTASGLFADIIRIGNN
ncbi:aspartate kinase [Nonlabens dokdonensis]|uniref:Aspartokinase/homoserine dehydrogenase n=2 Tax=Nonlabens dokdonensis TaxID=328515 RepID=L7WHG2_NONDD|nr:bifunctional aspartate kinase/homoserine dehydrogenase I [Nonlabens dokdonensis]AGC78418.1 aspartokinase/homoserine dehydrogenase [Nonlabens dokdonensis DSW-6]PZX38165.1 aspartate kinase [Nonlabens dokdonensis]